MAEINLLPEDLRKKEIEEKRRIAKHPKSFEIVLNQPVLEKKKTTIKPGKKESWWRKILGYPTTSPVQYNEPVNEKIKERDINNFSFNFNINKPQEKNKVVEIKQVKENQPTRNWLSFLGKPKPLIISLPQIKKEMKKSENLKLKIDDYQSQPLTPIKDHNQETRFVKFIDKDFKNKETVSVSKKPSNFVKKYNDSWWQILMSLFVPVKHQNEKVKLVSDDNFKLKTETSQPINFQKSSSVAIKNHQVNNQTSVKSIIKDNSKIDKKKKKSTIAYNLVENKENINIPNINFTSLDFNQKLKERSEWWYLIIAIVVPVIILLLTYGFIFLGQSQLTASLKQRNALLDSKIKEIGDYEWRLKKNNELAERIKNIDNLRKNKLAWSNFFDLLEKYTLNGVYYNNLSIDTSGNFLLPGIADSYETVAKQLALLNQASDFVKDVKISNIQIFSDNKTGASGISFQLRLILADKVFSLKSK